jgi:hypothetical protein
MAFICMIGPRPLRIFLLLIACLCSAGVGLPPVVHGVEPRTEAESRQQNRFPEAIPEVTYQRWVEFVRASDPEKQAWLETLESNLGGYYFPVYLNRTLFGEKPYVEAADAWAYVKDDPQLPRILIIGDSISRAYTARVRKRLLGKANVHRAPANCGSTQYFIENGEAWLRQNGSAGWDFIIVNFGIHDGSRPEGYEGRLRQVLARLKQTGAKEILWVRTTPWGKGVEVLAEPEADLSRLTNPISDRVAHEEGLAILDAQVVMHPLVQDHLSRTDFTHWSDEASAKLGDFVAISVESRLRSWSPGRSP